MILNRTVWLMAVSQALFMSLNVFVIFIGGIIGESLSPIKNLSTLPVTLIIIGNTLSVMPVVRLMASIGRKITFLSVCVYAIGTIGLAIFSLFNNSFVLFCVAAFLFGAVASTMGQFRFAAIESVKPEQSTSATSLVILGGLVSAFLGPEIATLGRDWFAVEYVGSFLLLGGVFMLAFLLLIFYQSQTPKAIEKSTLKRPLSVIFKQPIFIVAVSGAVVGYGVMSYIMTATPMSMHIIDGHSLKDTKWVIQSHVIAMFLPSLFTPFVVRLLKIEGMMLTGVLLYAACVAIALISHGLIHYWWALLLLGLGWNFLYIGGTSLLSRSYQPNEKFKVQSINDSLIAAFTSSVSLSAGWLVFSFGWQTVLISSVPVLIFQAGLLIWWILTGRSRQI